MIKSPGYSVVMVEEKDIAPTFRFGVISGDHQERRKRKVQTLSPTL
jgi:hypothetical protein